VLIAPGGKILWRHNGQFNAEELRHVLVDALGAFYKP
jgi:hypothetical protein